MRRIITILITCALTCQLHAQTTAPTPLTIPIDPNDTPPAATSQPNPFAPRGNQPPKQTKQKPITIQANQHEVIDLRQVKPVLTAYKDKVEIKGIPYNLAVCETIIMEGYYLSLQMRENGFYNKTIVQTFDSNQLVIQSRQRPIEAFDMEDQITVRVTGDSTGIILEYNFETVTDDPEKSFLSSDQFTLIKISLTETLLTPSKVKAFRENYEYTKQPESLGQFLENWARNEIEPVLYTHKSEIMELYGTDYKAKTARNNQTTWDYEWKKYDSFGYPSEITNLTLTLNDQDFVTKTELNQF